MNARTVVRIGIVCLLAFPPDVKAQVGPLMDWIHKMSGPQLTQVGTVLSFGYRYGLAIDSKLAETFDTGFRGFLTGDMVDSWPEGMGESLRARLTRLSARYTPLRLAAEAVDSTLKTFKDGARYRPEDVDRITLALREAIDANGDLLSKLNDIRDSVRIASDRDSLRDAMLIKVVEAASNQELVVGARLTGIQRDLSTLSTDPAALDPLDGIRTRLTVVAGSGSFKTSEAEKNSVVNVLMISPTAEYLFTIQRFATGKWYARPFAHFAFESGVNVHYFFGDIEPFWTVSFPFYLVWRPTAQLKFGRVRRLIRPFRASIGAIALAPWEHGALLPGYGDLPRGRDELVLTFQLGLDFPFW
jgi:hypothetical protein